MTLDDLYLDYFRRYVLEEVTRRMLRRGAATTCQRHMAMAAIYASKLVRRRELEKIKKEATCTNAQDGGSA